MPRPHYFYLARLCENRCSYGRRWHWYNLLIHEAKGSDSGMIYHILFSVRQWIFPFPLIQLTICSHADQFWVHGSYVCKAWEVAILQKKIIRLKKLLAHCKDHFTHFIVHISWFKSLVLYGNLIYTSLVINKLLCICLWKRNWSLQQGCHT